MNIEYRIKEYLGNGGLFNPEMMDHYEVRKLIMDANKEIDRLRRALERIEAGYGWQGRVAAEALLKEN